MGFIESFIAWLVVTFIIAIILYVVFVYILGWLYPQVEDNILQPQTQNNEEIVVEEETATHYRDIYICSNDDTNCW